MPELHIITGSNGAGKSTVGPDYLPGYITKPLQIFNADKLFLDKQKELWKQGIRANKELRNIAYEYVTTTFDALTEAAINNSANFAYEGHFTNEATWDVPRRFKAAGYSIHLVFFGLTDPELSQLRVVDRAKEGGHYVSPLEVEANFYGNLEKLNQHFEMFDTVQVVDTSETEHLVLATFTNGTAHSYIPYTELPEWFCKHLSNMADRIPKT